LPPAVLATALAGLCAAAAALPPEGGPEEPSIVVSDRLDVRRTLLEVRVVDGAGRPVEGLGAADFAVRLGGRPARVEAADRVVAEGYGAPPAAGPDPPPPGDGGAAAALARGAAEPRQLLVLFFQTSLVPSHAVGFHRLHRPLDELLDGLPPEVAVAVAAFDSHLELHQDFTTDRAALRAAVVRSFGFNPAPFPPVPRAGVPSLARGIGERRARRAAFPGEALALVAEALAPLSGEKALVFVGWGLGRFGFGAITPGRGSSRARAALVRGRVPAFVLDVTDADFHGQETTLQGLADATGGQFFRAREYAGREVRRIGRTLGAGRYLLLVETPLRAPGSYALRVAVRGAGPSTRVLAPARVRLGRTVAPG
jgi:hypothetical protein